jgi:hypothetical protein
MEVYDGTDNKAKSCSIPCIALYPCNNSTGSWVFLNLQTKQQVRCLQWQKMVTTKLVIEQMNAYDPEAATQPIEAVQPMEVDATEVAAAAADNQPEATTVAIAPEQDEGVAAAASEESQEQEEPEDVPELEAQKADDSSDEEDDEEETAPRRSARIAGGILKPSRYAMATRIAKSMLNSEERNKVIEKAETDEIEQVFVDLQAVHPVYEDELEGFDPLNCHLFTVEKLLANGDFDKMKSRFVANGNKQDQYVYPDCSLPTVAVHSIMTALAVATCNPCMTEMVGPPVFIKCRPTLTQLIVKLLPGLR